MGVGVGEWVSEGGKMRGRERAKEQRGNEPTNERIEQTNEWRTDGEINDRMN